jgi:tetratricopeptide (TPR) repeat protein
MHSIFTYILAAGAGLLIAHFISNPPELRSMRLSQLIFVPVAMLLFVYFLPDGSAASQTASVGEFMCFLGVLGFLIVLLAPNIAYICGATVSNFLDPQDWTSIDEEIALRPIRRLIEQDQYNQALSDLDELLKKHKPTYEALLIKAKLLHHFGSVDETKATLLSLIELSHSPAQQLAVMENLALLDGQQQEPPKLLVSGTRHFQIHHELVVFQMTGDAEPLHKVIPPGVYKVQETLHRERRWLKLAGEDWGNAEMCWEAVAADRRPTPAPPKSGFFWQIARMHQSISAAIKRKPRFQQQAEAKKLFKEAGQLIRGNNWHQARQLLQQANTCDPDHYEIAYRWVQAVRQTAGDAETEQALSQVLQQSRWTGHEEQMLRELGRPVGR